jgi:hypothetical protein
MLAGELALKGIDVAIVERRASQSSACCTVPGRCFSTSLSPAGSILRRGPIGFS